MPKAKKIASRKTGGTAASRWSRGKPSRSSKGPAAGAARGAGTRKAPGTGPRSRAVRMQDAVVVRDPTHEEIAHHAYMRWTRHGGSEHDNWLAAERELRERRATLRARSASARKGSAR